MTGQPAQWGLPALAMHARQVANILTTKSIILKQRQDLWQLLAGSEANARQQLDQLCCYLSALKNNNLMHTHTDTQQTILLLQKNSAVQGGAIVKLHNLRQITTLSWYHS